MRLFTLLVIGAILGFAFEGYTDQSFVTVHHASNTDVSSITTDLTESAPTTSWFCAEEFRNGEWQKYDCTTHNWRAL